MSPARRKAFKIIAWFMAVSAIAFGLFTAVFAFIFEGQEIHAVHNAVVAALLLVISAPPAVAAARAPEQAWTPLLHLAAVGIAGAATMILSLRLDIFTLPFIVLVGVLLLLRVPRGAVFGTERPSVVLAVLTLAALVPLLVYASEQAELQRIDTTSEHAEFNHWVETSFYAVAILLLGALAAFRPAQFRFQAWSAGVSLAVLGGISLAYQGNPSALDAPWAWAALVGGVAFLGAAEWETTRSTRGRSP
ncbi:MAG TPA: hypothetical protein VHI54_11225 [Actinomycetota bacterium]|nr:hypothetical protein [Actinomycetota bacterium]